MLLVDNSEDWISLVKNGLVFKGMGVGFTGQD